MKLKRGETLEDDRISSLSDDLLCCILSLLPTKYSVATTTLSTRWKNLFASLPDLDFDDSLTDSDTTNVGNFLLFVSEVLLAVLAKRTYIRKFHLICNEGTYLASMVSSWISFVCGHNIIELIVQANLINRGSLPRQLFHCRALTTMRLQGKFFLRVPEYVHFPCLKTLDLSDLVLTDDESVKRFFGGCIVLENLYLSNCVIVLISVLEVSIDTLKCLSLDDINGDYALLLDAPRLEYFDCSSYATRGYYGNKLKSLVRASLDIELEDEQFEDEKVSQLTNLVSNARLLTLSGDSMEPHSYQTITFRNLTTLRVSVTCVVVWMSFPYLLDNAPSLEVLSFGSGLCDEEGFYPEPASYLPEQIPTCVSNHLKEVEVCFLLGEDEEFKMVEYFLKNGKVLEKMLISPSPNYLSNWRESKKLAVRKQFPMTKRLLTFPRCSRACRIVFMD